MKKIKKRTETEKRLIKDIQNLKRNIERRFKTIEKRGLSSPSIEIYRYKGKDKKLIYNNKLLELKGRYYDTSVRGKSLSKLQTIFNRLKYINGLKTSNYKGAEHYSNVVSPLLERVFEDKETSSKIIEIYNKYVNENAYSENFKYDIWENILENIDKSDEEIRDSIDNLYNDLVNGEKKPIKYKKSTKIF